jgi:hypothetical protein
LLERNELREVRSQLRGRIHALDDARSVLHTASRLSQSGVVSLRSLPLPLLRVPAFLPNPLP